MSERAGRIVEAAELGRVVKEIQSLPSSRRTIFEGEKDVVGRDQMVAVETSGGHLTMFP